jgi:predicted transcriptional regulator
MAPETRLPLADVAEVLGVSERTVRRHINGQSSCPTLPARKGATGITVQAGELRSWIEDAERAERFRESA